MFVTYEGIVEPENTGHRLLYITKYHAYWEFPRRKLFKGTEIRVELRTTLNLKQSKN